MKGREGMQKGGILTRKSTETSNRRLQEQQHEGAHSKRDIVRGILHLESNFNSTGRALMGSDVQRLAKQ